MQHPIFKVNEDSRSLQGENIKIRLLKCKRTSCTRCLVDSWIVQGHSPENSSGKQDNHSAIPSISFFLAELSKDYRVQVNCEVSSLASRPILRSYRFSCWIKLFEIVSYHLVECGPQHYCYSFLLPQKRRPLSRYTTCMVWDQAALTTTYRRLL